MAIESKPLFNPEVVHQHVHAYTLPESVAAALPRLQHWAELISSGKADAHKETALLPDFITDVFGSLLGYTGSAGAGDSFTLLSETHVEVDGQFADAALGRFTTTAKHFHRSAIDPQPLLSLLKTIAEVSVPPRPERKERQTNCTFMTEPHHLYDLLDDLSHASLNSINSVPFHSDTSSPFPLTSPLLVFSCGPWRWAPLPFVCGDPAGLPE